MTEVSVNDGAGFRLFPGWFDRGAQERLVATLRQAVTDAPFYTPTMPRTGKPFSVRGKSGCWSAAQSGA